MNNSGKIILISLFIILTSNLSSQDSITLPKLNELIEIGLINNYDIQISKKRIDISKGALRSSEGVFDISLGADLNLEPGIQPDTDTEDYYSFDLSLNVPTKVGMNFTSGFSYLREIDLGDTDSPTDNVNGVWLQMDMPLLKGLGNYNTNLTNLQLAELEVTYSQVNFDYETTLLIKNILTTYYTVLTFNNICDNFRTILKGLNSLQNDLSLEVESGLVAKSELLVNQAEINLLTAQLRSANNTLNSAYINLMTLIGQKGEVQYVETLDVYKKPIFTAKDSLHYYLKFMIKNRDSIVRENLTFAEQVLNQQNADLQLKEAKNGVLNDLSLQLKYNFYAIEENEAFDDFIIFGKSSYPGSSYLISLNYTLPFGNNVARGTYTVKTEEYNLQQEVTDKLVFEMKKSIENTSLSILDSYAIYDMYLHNIEVRKQIYNNELVKFKEGTSTQIDVLQVRRDLIETTEDFYSAQLNYIKLLINLKFICNKIPRNSSQLEYFNLFSLDINK